MQQIVKGAIFYADLEPSIGSEQKGIRPVLVIQNDLGNKYSPTTIIAPISTKKDCNLPTHILIKQFDKIRHNSIIMLEQIRTIDKVRLKDFICFLNEDQLKEVDVALIKSLDIDLSHISWFCQMYKSVKTQNFAQWKRFKGICIMLMWNANSFLLEKEE